jgi:TetR/AcrR family transcriptional regulator, mexJK operon transcriptional repressor
MSSPAHISDAKEEIISRVADVLCQERATATNIESVVYKAAVDRDAVIAKFGSMHGLLLEMVSNLSDELIQPLEQQSMDRTMRDVLIEFGIRLAHTYAASHLIALYRITLSEATRHSGIGRDFFERGPARLTACLARYFEFSVRRFGKVRLSDARRLADNFLNLLGDTLEFSDWMTTTRVATAKDCRDAVIEAVDLFYYGLVKGEQ